MATDKTRFLVSRTYSIVTPESAAIGDESESGYEFQDTPMSLEDLIDELADCQELSSWPIRSANDLSGHEWASTEPSTDWRNGETRQESVHIRGINNETLDGATIYRIFRLAQLV